MTQNTISFFVNLTRSKLAKKNYSTEKNDVHQIDDTKRLDLLDLKDYGPENNGGHRYVLLVIEKFSELGWTVPLKSKISQTKANSSEIILITSKRKPNLIKTD